MKLNKKMIRAAIKARIDERNAFDIYGRRPSTRWNAPIPEHHFYMRNNGLTLTWSDGGGEITDKDGNVIARFVRKWSTKKERLTYRELMPTIEWL